VKTFDLFVIGAGSGGVRASRMAAATGAAVGIAESGPLGGTCVNVGCVPKKLLVYAAHVAHDVEDARGFGWDISTPIHDWAALIRSKDAEIARLNGIYGGLLDGAGVSLLSGQARLLDAHTVQVGEEVVRAEHIVIATGSTPRPLEIPGGELAITSNEIFALPALPQRVLIVGGGYIAVEFAGILNGLGAKVTQIYRGEMFLRGFDDDLRQGLATIMPTQGVDLRFNCNVSQIEQKDDGLHCTLTDGSTLVADQVLSAIGRVPLVDGLGLDAAGVRCAADGAIEVDAWSRTNVPQISAIGDVTNRMNLTPVAIAEAMALVQTLYHDNPTKPQYQNIATAVFSTPPMATVGLTEPEARQQYAHVDVYRSTFRPMKYTLAGREERSVMKLLVDRDTDRVLGVHMLGPDAGEIMQGFGVALVCGATKAQFDATIGIHPTSAEEFVTMRTPVQEI